MGVFILSGCESNLTTNSGNESITSEETVENQEATADRPMREPGEIDPFKITDLIREVLKEKGRDPNEVRFGELSDKGIALTGEEAWDKYMEDWEFGAKSFFKASSSTSSVIFNPESPITSFSTLPPTPAETQFEVVGISNPPVSGSITVQYLGEQVTTNYSSGQSASTVAYSIYGNINNDPDIQLTATVPSSGKVLLTEKREGCEHNGNSVYVSHSNGTHISVNNDTFIMTGGEDVEGCEDVPPPPDDDDGSNITPIEIAWGQLLIRQQAMDG